MNLVAIRGLPFCPLVLGPNVFFTKMCLLCVQQTGLTFPLRSLSCWWSSDPATLCPSRIFLTPVSWLQNSHRQIAHLYPTEWGRRLGWAGEAFIKGMSCKLPSHVHLSTDLTLVVPSGAGAPWGCRAAGEFAVLCGPGAAWAWVSNSDVRRRENSFEYDKLQIVFLQDSFC